MKYILGVAILFSLNSFGQQSAGDDKKIVKGLKKTIGYLADDKLEGRRTGSRGEKLAYEYIEKAFKKAGLKTFTADNNYIQPFDVNDGREMGADNSLVIDGKMYRINEDYFPYPFSASVQKLSFGINEIAYYNTDEIKEQNKNNPHFDLNEHLLGAIKNETAAGKKIFIVRGGRESQFAFDPKDKTPVVAIPALYLIPRKDRDIISAKDIKSSVQQQENSWVSVSITEKNASAIM